MGVSDITCVQVDPANGNVSLQWTPPTDPNGEFQSYQLFTSIAGGGFIQVTGSFTNYLQNAYNLNITAGLSSQVCFFLQSTGVTASGLSYVTGSSDTLCSINLEVQPSTNGLYPIAWTNPYEYTTPQPSGLQYQLLIEASPGIWTNFGLFPLDSTELVYEPFDFCQQVINFQVILTNDANCQMHSDIEGGLMENINPPVIPVITSVSVLPSGDVEITWNQNPSADTQGYNVYVIQGSNAALLDVVNGIADTTYLHTSAATSIGSITYNVAAFDNCTLGSPPNFNTSAGSDIPSSTIFLQQIAYPICSNQVVLSWTPYQGWDNGVDYYIIHHSTDGLNYAIIDTVEGNQLNYVDTTFTLNSTNSYYIEGVSRGPAYHATSNVSAFLAAYPQPPAYTYIAAASVDQGKINIDVLTAPTTFLVDYMLQRERVNEPGIWQDVYNIQSQNLTSLLFTDEDVNPNIFSYKYRIVSTNFCLVPIDTSNLGKTILAEGVADQELLQNLIQWTPYRDWPQGVSKYKLYRKQSAAGSYNQIYSDNNADFYKDDVSPLYEEPGDFCYYVEAMGAPFPGLPDSVKSISNEVCITMPPRIWIPNAFVTDSRNEQNRNFGPVLSFADVKNFQMIIYSRWGNIIYETTDPKKPWDGTVDGKTAPEGMYAYFIRIEDGRGTPIDRRGTVMLIDGPEQ